MDSHLRQHILDKFGRPVNSPRDCKMLAEEVYSFTKRSISEATLRRFFGLLPSKSSISTFNLDTLAIYCGASDYKSLERQKPVTGSSPPLHSEELTGKISQITRYTLKSISVKSLGGFQLTIPREEVNAQLNNFLDSTEVIFPVVAPGGHGKSTALAHWISDLKDNVTALFCPASLFLSMLLPKKGEKNQLSLQLTRADNLINWFLNQPGSKNTKLLIALDALDETGNEPDKINLLAEYILQAANLYHGTGRLKIVFTVREAAWQSHLANRFNQKALQNLTAQLQPTLEAGFSNMPLLSNHEILSIVDHYNEKADYPLIYESIPWDLREMIRIPINLYLISKLFSRENSLKNISNTDIIREYIRVFVFESVYAEQKQDVINTIIMLMAKQGDYSDINKNELKNLLPVHLKRETGYYNAFRELLQAGILMEERTINKYGTLVTSIRFKHTSIFYYLLTLYLIEKNNQLDFELIRSVATAKDNPARAQHLTALLYEIAYELENYDVLERFCELPGSIIGSFSVRMSVGKSFRINNGIRNRLIETFAASRAGRMYFFEQFVDTNYLFNNYVRRILAFLKHENGAEPTLFGHSILFLAGFLKMDTNTCQKHFAVISNIQPGKNIYPWPSGRKVASHILYNYFVEGRRPADLWPFTEQTAKIAYTYPGYLERGFIEFELYIMVALALVQEFEVLEKLLDHAFRHYYTEKNEDPKYTLLRHNQNTVPHLFMEYARYKLGKSTDDSFETMFTGAIENYTTTFDDYIFLLLLNWFMFDYFTDKGVPEKADYYFEAGIKLSRFAGYDFFTAFFLYNHPGENKDIALFATQMIEESGFNLSLFTYPSGPCASQQKSSEQSS